jgi:hypothetical protein
MFLAPAFEHERAASMPEPPRASTHVPSRLRRPGHTAAALRASAHALKPGLLVPPLSMRRPCPQADPLSPTRPAAFPSSRPATAASVDAVLQQKLED